MGVYLWCRQVYAFIESGGMCWIIAFWIKNILFWYANSFWQNFFLGWINFLIRVYKLSIRIRSGYNHLALWPRSWNYMSRITFNRRKNMKRFTLSFCWKCYNYFWWKQIPICPVFTLFCSCIPDFVFFIIYPIFCRHFFPRYRKIILSPPRY